MIILYLIRLQTIVDWLSGLCFILSRTKTLPAATLLKARSVYEANGIPTFPLTVTNQDSCPASN